MSIDPLQVFHAIQQALPPEDQPEILFGAGFFSKDVPPLSPQERRDEEDKSELQAVCEAALITSIRKKEEGVVSLCVFPEGSEIITVGNVAHSLALEDNTWHFISECQTDS